MDRFTSKPLDVVGQLLATAEIQPSALRSLAPTAIFGRFFEPLYRDLNDVSLLLKNSALAPGKTLLGKYELGDPIGKGGIAIVASAYGPKDELLVAKFPMPDPEMWDNRIESVFKLSAEVQSSLSGRYTPRLVDCGEVKGWPILVSEYIPGKDLRTILSTSRRPLDLHLALAVASDVCSGLGEMHSKGIRHCDIKPENIILTPSGETRVIDFELARLPDMSRYPDLTNYDQGTAAFMSPEQARRESVDERSDLYCLGTTLFAFVTGDLPYRTTETKVMLTAKREERPWIPAITLNGQVPKNLSRLIDKAIQPDPDRRFQSAAEMKEAIDSLAVNL